MVLHPSTWDFNTRDFNPSSSGTESADPMGRPLPECSAAVPATVSLCCANVPHRAGVDVSKKTSFQLLR